MKKLDTECFQYTILKKTNDEIYKKIKKNLKHNTLKKDVFECIDVMKERRKLEIEYKEKLSELWKKEKDTYLYNCDTVAYCNLLEQFGILD